MEIDYRKIAEFAHQHRNDDVVKLLLGKSKYPDIEMNMAAETILSKRKLTGKVDEWAQNPELVFPRSLSAEQCSSLATARYKANLVGRITPQAAVADLTGGLGVDSWCFSKVASRVLYNEMDTSLCNAVRYNFNTLNVNNIHTSNIAIDPSNILSVIEAFCPDVVYMDPARRDGTGKKVFLMEDCSPDVLGLKDIIFQVCRHLVVKLSPMADITMVCERLGSHCREVHIVSARNECKEVLVWMDRDWDGEAEIACISLGGVSPENCLGSEFRFLKSEESTSVATICNEFPKVGDFLFEPDKALMKAGAYKTLSERFALPLLGKSAHFYLFSQHNATVEEKIDALPAGKLYEVIECQKFSKQNLKDIAVRYPYADLTARGLLIDTNALKKKMDSLSKSNNASSSGNIHIFALHTDILGDIILITKRFQSSSSL